MGRLRLEAFTQGKTHATPDTNEDALLVLPGRAYAVVDGVTDRVGTRYGGVLSGRHAAQLIVRTLEHALSAPDAPLDDPGAILRLAGAALRGVYDAAGTTEAVRADPNRQMAAALALVTIAGGHAHILLAGDSGVRLDGTRVWQDTKEIDTVTAALRTRAWHLAATRTDDLAERERVSRAVCWSGAAHAGALVTPVLRDDDLRALAEDTVRDIAGLLPHLPGDAVREAVAGGIIHAQGGYANNPGSPLGYPLLNGFDIPAGTVRIERVPLAGLRTIELFSDGYFAPGRSFGVNSWEARFREVEAEDPHKIGPYASTKGTIPAQWSDDRTYLGVAL